MIEQVIESMRSGRFDPAMLPAGCQIVIDERSGRPDTVGDHLGTLVASLRADQRAGLTAVSSPHRTVVIAPATIGDPSSRIVFAFSHPDDEVVEAVAYTDGTDLSEYRSGEYALQGSAAAVAIPAAEDTDPEALAHARVLVVASSDGLGAAVADAFERTGARVVRHGARSEGRGVFVSADLSRDGATAALVQRAAALLDGPITILIDCFGPWDSTPVASASIHAWRTAVDEHATRLLELARAVAPGMRERGNGRIIAISAGSAAARADGLYGAGKGVRELLVELLARELAPEITVNTVAPGQIAESVPTMTVLDPHAITRELHRTPAGRFVTRREVADAVVALCTPAFDSLTGATIPLDGGARIGAFS